MRKRRRRNRLFSAARGRNAPRRDGKIFVQAILSREMKMATIEQEKEQRDKLQKALQSLSEITPESLVRGEDLGKVLDFSGGINAFRRVLELFKELAKCSLDDVSHSKMRSLAEKAEEALKRFREIQEFTVQKYPNNPESKRDDLISQVQNSYDTMYDTIMPVLGYFARKSTDLEAIAYEAKQGVAAIRTLETKAKEEYETAKLEVHQLLESMRKAAGEAGVSQNAIYFAQEAKEHAAQAEKWLTKVYWMVGIVSAIALGLSFYYAFGNYDLSPAHTVQFAISKIIFFSVLFFALAVCNRNYRAHRHNYVVNKHRQNALATFETFVKGTSDEATKNAVLLKSAETIFTSIPTGYISKDSEPQGTSQVFEIVRSVLGKGHE
jgi:hypothetical protein